MKNPSRTLLQTVSPVFKVRLHRKTCISAAINTRFPIHPLPSAPHRPLEQRAEPPQALLAPAGTHPRRKARGERKRSHRETLVSAAESWEGKGRALKATLRSSGREAYTGPLRKTGSVFCKDNTGMRSLVDSQTWEILSGNFRRPRSRNCIFWAGTRPRRMEEATTTFLDKRSKRLWC